MGGVIHWDVVGTCGDFLRTRLRAKLCPTTKGSEVAPMPRYKLRTLLIVLAFLPASIAAVWWYVAGFGDEIYRRSLRTNVAIRNELLAYTPLGTPGAEVLEFVLNKLKCVPPAKAPHGWVHEYDKSLLNIGSSVLPEAGGRTIRVTIGRRITIGEERVDATWHFDENNKVNDITVERYRTFP